ncbi:MAG TPA: hypothetical protein VFM74_07345 [Candidatus Limnocylindria bacterium]|nr:hypothetical protein [Candidatus Limnocylindria bacterium]
MNRIAYAILGVTLVVVLLTVLTVVTDFHVTADPWLDEGCMTALQRPDGSTFCPGMDAVNGQ